MNLKMEETLGFTKFVSWAVLIIFILQLGAMLITFIKSLSYPEASKELYMGLNLSSLYSQSIVQYSLLIILLLVQIILKIGVVAYLIKMLKDLKLDSPFSFVTAKNIERITYLIIALSVVIWITDFFSGWLVEQSVSSGIESTSLEFILLADVLFIFSQIFKRGVELQSENEMTV
jgi:hypothetical protein